MNKIIEICNVSAAYGESEVLNQVSLTIEKGEFIVIIGPSGCGKTTLLKTINGLVVPTKGEVLVKGEQLKECNLVFMRRNIGYAVQGAKLFPHMSVEDNICYVPELENKMTGDEKSRLVRRMLEMVELPFELAVRFPRQLSGGQKQRASIARALSNNPSIILADEPTGNLDTKSSAAVIGAFLDAKEKIGATIFMVTHDAFAASYADKVIALRDGIVFGELLRRGQPKEFLDELLDFTRKVNGDEYDA